MKKRLAITMALSIALLAVSAQETHNSRVMQSFSDSLNDMSASFQAYVRLWDDLDAPAPRKKQNGDYYKLFVPPTFYLAPLKQEFAFEWEPKEQWSVPASDSIYQAKEQPVSEFQLPDLQKSAKIDRWINQVLLRFCLERPELVMGNELYFTGGLLLDDVQVVNAPRQEDMKSYMKVSNPVDASNAGGEFQVFKPNFWTKAASASLQFSQHGISDNWYQGGESTNALLSEVKLTANYDDRQKVQFENSLEIKLGFITAPSDTVHSYKTNADMFRLNSKLGVRAIKNLYYTLTGEFKTQFFSNYKTNTNDLISSFFSPAQLKFSLGMDYKLEQTKYKLSLMGAPFSYTYVFLANDKIVNPSSFNVEPGKTSASLFGSEITANLNWAISNNITWTSKLEYFTTYDKVIANWENTFNFQLNRYLSTKFFLHTRFDDGVTLTEDNKSYFQFKEMLTFGLAYTW